MNKTSSAAAQRPLAGIALMTLAMLIIPLVDGAAKHLSQTHSPLFVSWARYAVASLVIAPLAFARFGVGMFPDSNLGAHLWRTVFLMTAMTLYFVAISITELAVAASAYFCAPIVATMIAVIVYREAFTWHKALALVLGFAGVLLVVQPGPDLRLGSLLGLLAGIFFALYLVATRLASQNSDPLQTLAFQSLVGLLILLPQALASWSVPVAGELGFFAALGLLSAASHFCAIVAFRYADTSTLAPFVYVELIGVIAVGMLFFNEYPSPAVWTGAAIIVIAGLLLIGTDKR